MLQLGKKKKKIMLHNHVQCNNVTTIIHFYIVLIKTKLYKTHELK